MGILDDILAVIPADEKKNDAGAGPTPPADAGNPNEEAESGWYGKEFRETYMEPKQPQQPPQ